MNTTLFRIVAVAVLVMICLPVPAQKAPMYEQPILISSAGQSADVTMAGMLCKRLGLNAKAVTMAKPNDLEGMKTLIIVPGFSSKGLGAAGTSREDEMTRVKKLLEAAKEKKIKILALHLGGKARRGQQSDDFNSMAAEAASYLIVVKQGDEDQFFTKIAAERKIPIRLVGRIADATQPLEEVFK